MRRAIVPAGLAVAAIVPFLVACTPPMDNRTALELRDDGAVQLDVILCAHESIRRISLSELSASVPREWSVENPSNERRQGGMDGFSAILFQRPADWSVGVETLSELDDATRYYLHVSTSNPPAFTMEFSLDELGDLEDGQVLVATQRGARAMTREDFESDARADCE